MLLQVIADRLGDLDARLLEPVRVAVAAHLQALAVHLVLHAEPELVLGVRDPFFLDVCTDRLGNVLAGRVQPVLKSSERPRHHAMKFDLDL